MEIMLDKKQMWAIFLWVRMGHKAAETTCSINNALVQELLMNIQCSGGSRSFAKEVRALKMRSIVAGHQKLTTTNSEPLAKLILLKLHEKVPQEFNVSQSMVFWHLNQIGKVKKLDKWVPDELTENFFKLSFLDQIVICDEKCILFDNFWWSAQWLDWEEAPKLFPKPNLHQKKVMIPNWCFAADLIHYSFLNPSKTITSEKYA